MTEINNSTQSECRRIGHAPENGPILWSEWLIERKGQYYTVSLANRSYLQQMIEANQQLNPEVQLDVNSLIHDGSHEEDQVCPDLASRSLEELGPYLTVQNPPDPLTTE